MGQLASIVIANYNYGRFLRAAIDSALAQTYAPLEVIVVDDGSTDESRAIIPEYADRVHAILKPNGGQASAWNAGFAVSRGQVVLFLDADDVLLAGALERAMPLFEDPRVSKVHWPLAVILHDGCRSGRVVPPQPVSSGDLREYVIASGPGGHPGHVWPPSSGNAWARRYLERVLPIREEAFRVSPDLYLVTLAPLYGLVGGLREPQACWRVHGTNNSWNTSFDHRLEHALRLWEECAETLARHCRAQSIEPDLDRWRDRAWYHRIDRALDEVCRVVPPGAVFVLADEGEWDTDAVVRGRARLPMVERDGTYWGPPVDDLVAVEELVRLHHRGAEYLVVAWPAFWWLEHYRGWSGSPANPLRLAAGHRSCARYSRSALARPPGPDRMPTRPLATIVIANYNYGRFLRAAIDSALAQTYAPLEVIVVDDGSTDESRAIIASYGDAVRTILKTNGGQASAWNVGFAVSRGEVVLFLDADDLYLPDAVGRAMPHFDDPETVKVQWPMEFADVSGGGPADCSRRHTFPDGDLREAVFFVGPTNHLTAPSGASAWARWFLDQVFPLPEALYRNGCDTCLFEVAPFFGRVKSLSEPLSLYRQHGANDHVSMSAEAKVERELLFYDHYTSLLRRHFDRLGRHPDYNAWLRGSWWHRHAAAIEELNALPEPHRPLILADEGTWELGPIAGRERLPFLEANGEYAGPPAGDAQAIAELQRMQAMGARFIAFAWPAFWWLDHYAGLRACLDRYSRVIESERVIVFDLDIPTAPPAPSGCPRPSPR